MGFNVDIKLDMNKVAPELLLFILAFFGLWAGNHYNIALITSFSVIVILGLFIYGIFWFMFKIFKMMGN